MEAEKLNQFTLLIPQIKTRVKKLKNRRNKKIQRINQVTDPTMTLISGTEGTDNLSIKRENVIKIKTYLQKVALSQAKIEVNSGKTDYKALYALYKNQISSELNKIEDAITKLQANMQGGAARFFDDFGNGALNDDIKFLGEFEKLIVMLASKQPGTSNNETFEKMKTYLSSETQKIVNILKTVCVDISKDPSKFVSQSSKINLFSTSTIVRPEESDMINNWIKEQLGSNKTFTPLFNTRDHGYTAGAFHQRCDNKGPTIVFIESTSGKRFGGYANSSWNIEGAMINDQKCFIFSLDLKEKYLNRSGNTYAMKGNSFNGPNFGNNGNNNGFWIIDNCNCKQNTSSRLNDAYDTRSRSETDIAGGTTFNVKTYEVFQVIQYSKLKN